MKSLQLKDNIQFEDEEEIIIFNHYSFCELIKHIMVQYGKVTYAEAQQKLGTSFLNEAPQSWNEVELLGHELEYHWAMHCLHGHMYWLNGIPSDFNDFKNEYLTWEKEITEKYNLKKSFEYYEKK
ncbi:hypothetical protein [Aquimarina litoralis]|uniref:hypothetical protein n=1 Tax=Aquimarina litoralis TaxID=584605 RepID=UPI001C5A1D1E|nr:hypothetical protein [Aquimarina litoralis]MBW1294166.1 hypothetical protein [Aquimarina litoralis]